jgi:hypothetical protein
MRLPGVYPAALIVLLAACSTATPPPDIPPPAAPVSLAPHVDCAHPPAPESEGVQGDASSGSVVAWVMADKSHGMPVGQTYKIVWRVTGTGQARFSASSPGSAPVAPVWGPEGPRGSSFHYPGDEWGTGFVFPTPGCWTIHVTRDDMSGSLSLPIT